MDNCDICGSEYECTPEFPLICRLAFEHVYLCDSCLDVKQKADKARSIANMFIIYPELKLHQDKNKFTNG